MYRSSFFKGSEYGVWVIPDMTLVKTKIRLIIILMHNESNDVKRLFKTNFFSKETLPLLKKDRGLLKKQLQVMKICRKVKN